MVLLADRALLGPRPAEALEPVPRDDYVRALVDHVGELRDDLDSDTRNVILTLARIWCSLETGRVRSKNSAADWALARLPAEQRHLLARARAVYLGEEDDCWDDARPATAQADYVVTRIERLAGMA
jgi:streptomycin 3"-adenylyltransferase